jgi:type IV pilus assembly protein PilA
VTPATPRVVYELVILVSSSLQALAGSFSSRTFFYEGKMNRKGFTLIELLIVVVIIGILAAIAIPKFANTKGKAYVTAMKSDLRNLVSSQEAFFSDSSRYTANLTNLGFKQSTGTIAPTIVPGAGYWSATNSHTQLANTSCGIAVGTTNPVISTAGEGEPVCRP